MSKLAEYLFPQGECCVHECSSDATIVMLWSTEASVDGARGLLTDGFCEAHGRQLMHQCRDFKLTGEIDG